MEGREGECGRRRRREEDEEGGGGSGEKEYLEMEMKS